MKSCTMQRTEQAFAHTRCKENIQMLKNVRNYFKSIKSNIERIKLIKKITYQISQKHYELTVLIISIGLVS